jgi:cohesin loading factor subunit SCC2
MSDFRGHYVSEVANGRLPVARSSQPSQRPQGPAPPQGPFTRPFNLYEALPYSPFTAITPFNSDIIPTPSVASISPAPSLANCVNTADFDALNNDAVGGQSTSKRLEQTLAQMSKLITSRKKPE